MKYLVEINCDNAEFDHGNAARTIARLLKKAATKLVENNTPYQFKLMDVNSNTVGHTRIEEDGADPTMAALVALQANPNDPRAHRQALDVMARGGVAHDGSVARPVFSSASQLKAGEFTAGDDEVGDTCPSCAHVICWNDILVRLSDCGGAIVHSACAKGGE